MKPHRRPPSSRLVRLVACCAAAFVAACAAAHGQPEPPPVRVETAADSSVVETPNPERYPVVKAAHREVPDEVVTNCSVAWDINRAVPVVSIAGGRVVANKARLGDDVRRGQTLLVIDSPDLSSALADHRRALSALALAERNHRRAKELFDAKAGAKKDVEQAGSDLERAKVDVAAARDRIRIMGGKADQTSPVIQVKAPIGGTVVEQNVTRGAGVKSLDNSPNLFTIADLSRVWVLCDLYENNLADVEVGDTGEVRPNAFKNVVIKGEVQQISRVLDPVTRTAKIRLEVENQDGVLRPNMFATARFVSSKKQKRLVVPASSVLRLHDQAWVFKKEGAKRFRKVAVLAGAALSEGREVELHGGLRPDDEVVANALQLASSAAD